jgi:hypothetical protein
MLSKYTDVTDLPLSVRAKNVLKNSNVDTVEDLLKCTEDNLLGMKNSGKKTVKEILQLINEIKENNLEDENAESAENLKDDNFFNWIYSEEGKYVLKKWLFSEYGADDSILDFSPVIAEGLEAAGLKNSRDILFLTEEELKKTEYLDQESINEILGCCKEFLSRHQHEISKKAHVKKLTFDASRDAFFRYIEHNRERVSAFFKENDVILEKIISDQRSLNALKKEKINYLSDLILYGKSKLNSTKNLGKRSVQIVENSIDAYLTDYRKEIVAWIEGDDSFLYTDSYVKKKILLFLQNEAYKGVSKEDLFNGIGLNKKVEKEVISHALDELVNEKEINIENGIIYKEYLTFKEAIEKCPVIDTRSKEMILKKNSGLTLENIGKEYTLTRERVRQIIVKDTEKARVWYRQSTGNKFFKEDVFRYLYSEYTADSDSLEKIGLTKNVINYFKSQDIQPGDLDIVKALSDPNVSEGLKKKIEDSLKSDMIFAKGQWIRKRNKDIREFIVENYCLDDISLDDFIIVFNNFLEEHNVAKDSLLYLQDDSLHQTEARLSNSHQLLWKFNKIFRYYDIDARDYTELFAALNLEAYKNTEISVEKLMRGNEQVLKKYDIRNRYELHNLLRKAVPEGSYNNFRCERMPNIGFGKFDRDKAIMELIRQMSPVSQENLAAAIHEEYGYDEATIIATYLPPFSVYFHQGIYSVDNLDIPENKKQILKARLTEDFYFIDEIKKIYTELFPSGNVNEVNSYSLKTMGFKVYSKHAIQNFPNSETYFKWLLTKDDLTDITSYRKRFRYLPSFSNVFTELKRNRVIYEYAQNKIISPIQLRNIGIDEKLIQAFCDEVYDFVKDEYFTVCSLKKEGFTAKILEFDFDDWFYSGILAADKRFSYGQMYGGYVFLKGDYQITIKSFAGRLIRENNGGDIDVLIKKLKNFYGLKVDERSDIYSHVNQPDFIYLNDQHTYVMKEKIFQN